MTLNRSRHLASSTQQPEVDSAASIAPHHSDAPRALVARIGRRVYACDVAAIREVVELTQITRIPGAPPAVRGLINVRGAILTVVDGGELLHGAAAAEHSITALIVDVGARGVALLVDRVADVRDLRAEEGYLQLDVRELVRRVVNITENE